MVLPQRTYFTPDVPTPSCPFSPLAPCGPWAPVLPTAPWSPLGPGGPGNDLFVPCFPCSPTKYKNDPKHSISTYYIIWLKIGAVARLFFPMGF